MARRKVFTGAKYKAHREYGKAKFGISYADETLSTAPAEWLDVQDKNDRPFYPFQKSGETIRQALTRRRKELQEVVEKMEKQYPDFVE